MIQNPTFWTLTTCVSPVHSGVQHTPESELSDAAFFEPTLGGPDFLGNCGHSERRSRPAKIPSHVSSIRIGVPHIKIDLASPAELGFAKADNGARSISARVP